MEFIKMRHNGHSYYIHIFSQHPTDTNCGFAYFCDLIRFDKITGLGQYCQNVTLDWTSTMQICYEFNAAGWNELFLHYHDDLFDEQEWEEVADIRIGWYED